MSLFLQLKCLWQTTTVMKSLTVKTHWPILPLWVHLSVLKLVLLVVIHVAWIFVYTNLHKVEWSTLPNQKNLRRIERWQPTLKISLQKLNLSIPCRCPLTGDMYFSAAKTLRLQFGFQPKIPTVKSPAVLILKISPWTQIRYRDRRQKLKTSPCFRWFWLSWCLVCSYSWKVSKWMVLLQDFKVLQCIHGWCGVYYTSNIKTLVAKSSQSFLIYYLIVLAF